MESVLGKILL